MRKDLHFGVIGWGYWGPKIARNLDGLSQASVTAVADLDQKFVEFNCCKPTLD